MCIFLVKFDFFLVTFFPQGSFFVSSWFLLLLLLLLWFLLHLIYYLLLARRNCSPAVHLSVVVVVLLFLQLHALIAHKLSKLADEHIIIHCIVSLSGINFCLNQLCKMYNSGWN